METESRTKGEIFTEQYMLATGNRIACGQFLTSFVGHVVISLLLNSIRASASLWLLWPLVVLQFVLYCSIFSASYTYSKNNGLNSTVAFVLFVFLAVFGRVDDWGLIVLPMTVAGMFIFWLSQRRSAAVREEILTKDGEATDAKRLIALIATDGKSPQEIKDEMITAYQKSQQTNN